MRLHTISLLLAAADIARAATAAEWRSRSIYQVLTDRFALTNDSTTVACDPSLQHYCGGTWQGIISKLDYIQDMGFDAIWISPVTSQVKGNTDDGAAYHGFWPDNMNELNENFGTSDDLKALSAALHSRGMYLMVDVVVNQMAWIGEVSNVAYNTLIPFNNESYYHSYCPITNNAVVCWQGGGDVQLPDLRTEDTDVRTIFGTFISNLVTTYNIDGLRLDSAINVDVDFFTSFTKAAGVFATGEVLSGLTTDVCPYQAAIGSALNYPLYFPLTRAFSGTGTFTELAQEMNQIQQQCNDTTIMGNFAENHDQPRFPSVNPDLALAKNIIAFTMLTDGIPIIYEGQEQHYGGGATPDNREAIWLSGYNTSSPLYNHITDLNVFRKLFSNSSEYLTSTSAAVYNATNTFALKKGQAITILNNVGSSGPAYNITLPSSTTGYSAGDLVTDILSCKNVTVDGTGSLDVTVAGGLPNVFYPTKLLAGSTVCNNGVTTFKAPPPSSTLVTLSPTATGKSKPTGSSGSGSGSSDSSSTSKSAGNKPFGVSGAVLVVSALTFLASSNIFA